MFVFSENVLKDLFVKPFLAAEIVVHGINVGSACLLAYLEDQGANKTPVL